MSIKTDVTMTVNVNGITKTFTATASTGSTGNEVARGLIDVLAAEANRWVANVPANAPRPQTAWPAQVCRNAATLRAAYPRGLPRHSETGAVIVRRVRARMGWSNDKASPAVRAYLAGADLDDDSERQRVVATG